MGCPPDGVPAFVSSPVTFDEKKLDMETLLVKLIDFGEGKVSLRFPSRILRSRHVLLTLGKTQRPRHLPNSEYTRTLKTPLQNLLRKRLPRQARTSGLWAS